jgi:hypothetical protein
MGLFAGFILCSTLTMTCEAYVDPHEYSNFHECRAKGNVLYNELVQVASSTDVVLGDCSEVPAGADPKDFFTKLLKARLAPKEGENET